MARSKGILLITVTPRCPSTTWSIYDSRPLSVQEYGEYLEHNHRGESLYDAERYVTRREQMLAGMKHDPLIQEFKDDIVDMKRYVHLHKRFISHGAINVCSYPDE